MYKIRILRRAIKDISKVPRDYAQLISQHIDGLTENPLPPDAKKLKGASDYRLRVGIYRILYDINDEEQTITIYRVKHRREAYR